MQNEICAPRGAGPGSGRSSDVLDERFHVWAVVEVERQIGDPVVARDSLNRLAERGWFTNCTWVNS